MWKPELIYLYQGCQLCPAVTIFIVRFRISETPKNTLVNTLSWLIGSKE